MKTRTHNLKAAALGNQMKMLWSPFATPQIADSVCRSLALSASRCLALSPEHYLPSHAQVSPEVLESRLGYQTLNVQGYVYHTDKDQNEGNQDSPAPPIALASPHWWCCQ